MNKAGFLVRDVVFGLLTLGDTRIHMEILIEGMIKAPCIYANLKHSNGRVQSCCICVWSESLELKSERKVRVNNKNTAAARNQ